MEHENVPFYLTAENYQDWWQRAKTPPSPSESEKVKLHIEQEHTTSNHTRKGTDSEVESDSVSEKTTKKQKYER